ncbi:phage tail tape measure protein [Streptomyces scabiei]|uniref:phage tail tape measure protein n=1 Tax=Streptomyces scabiei TaxID=1930 RepID=UPI001B30C874|nr:MULTISPECIES: phage tail tape measure protein [Streptomyces]MDX2749657.1 phage tail tape measure protein [Streptomyces scabiei]MDX3033878.1 phage tail tape measure protein [Streptomyces scabiei]MDX3146475.1 phage tail tape measure protein [Streptomyces scabiei]MDX3196881.1 phage tail tape measure protein [Streptomyces scabiei]MDX3208052.1 phage tail tape measure protein [Streptomyces scabiei]
MAVRTVSVILTADITAFRARMGEASRTAGRTSRDIRTRMRDAGRTMVRVGENQRTALKMVQGASIGLIAAFGFAVAASARFEKAMSNVRAVTQANGAEMVKLRSAALEMGRTTAFSAVQAAEAEHELAKAGVSTADIAGGALRGALNLAAAAEINVAEGAEIAANAMTVFGLKGKDVGHVADVLAAAANKSTTDVHQMGLSLRMAGQVASQTGLSLEDTVGALTLFAAEGLKGSDAGTSFKVMLQRLTPQSKEAQATMDKLGFSAYDAQGNFVGLHEMAARMKESFAGLTPEARNSAMGIIFGSDAVRAANIIYKHGAEGVQTYTDAVNDQGYAQAVAMTRMDNLIGDVKLLRAALESALIETGTAANSSLRDMVQWVTRLVNAYSSLPPGLQQSVGLLTGLVGILGLAGASMLLLLPRIMLVRRELIALGITSTVVRAQMMTLGKLGLVLGALTAVAWGIDSLADKMRGAGPDATKLANSLVDLAQKGKKGGELTKAFGKDLDGFGEAVARIAHPNVAGRFEDFLSTFDPMADGSPWLEDAREKVAALDEALASLVASGATDVAAEGFKQMAAEAEKHGTSAEKLLTLLPSYANGLAGADTQAKITAASEGELGEATAMTADEMADQRTAAEKLTEALNLLNGVAITTAEQQIAFEQSLDDLAAAVKENGTGLDITSEKGRAVKTAFLDSAKAAQEYAQSVADQKGSVEAGNAVLETSIGALKRTMKQAGFTEKQIKDLIGRYAQIPPKTGTEVKAETDGAISDLENVQRKVKNTRGKKITVDALTKAGEAALERLGYKVKRTKGKKVTITVPTGSQQAAVYALASAIAGLRDKSVRITTYYSYKGKNIAGVSAGRMSYGGIVGHAADGLYIPGYAPRIDDQLILASRGEGVLVPETVRKGGQRTGLGPAGFIGALNNWGRLGTRMPMFADGGIVGYAKGGTVKRKKTTPQSVINARRELPGDFGDFSRSLTKSASEIKSAAKALATDLKKLGKTGWRLAGQVERTSRKLQSLADKRDNLREKIAEGRQFAKDQTSSSKEFMALGDGKNARALIKDLKARQAEATDFKKDVDFLRKRGLNKDLLRQVIEEGPGSDLAERLMTASGSEFKELNSLAKKGAGLAKSIGRASADALYDAGKNAGKGFLQGLISQEKALQKQMDKLGQSLVKAIKKALKIKSPSAVMRDQVGMQLGAGLVQGMDRTLVDVQAAGHRMSAAAISAAWGGPPPGSAAATAGGQFTGQLFLDNGTFLGAVKGTVQPMIRESEQRQAFRAKVGGR